MAGRMIGLFNYWFVFKCLFAGDYRYENFKLSVKADWVSNDSITSLGNDFNYDRITTTHSERKIACASLICI